MLQRQGFFRSEDVNSEGELLNNKIDELSLLLVMLDLGDSVGYEAALESLNVIHSAISSENYQRIKLAAAQILEKSFKNLPFQ